MRSFYYFLPVVLCFATACSRPPESTQDPDPAAAREVWIRETMAAMTLQEKTAQLFMVPLPSGLDPSDAGDRAHMADLVERFQVGGVVFFAGNPINTAAWAAWLQSRARIPLLTALDAEWGAAMRLDGLTRFPRAMMLGAAGDTAITREVGRLTALDARAAGMNVIFAPDADVNTESANPVIGTRSFGDDPDAVARHAVSFARGVASAGVLPVAKHFPGHGGVSADSHTDLPIVDRPAGDFERLDLPPFKALIADSLAALMSAHVIHRSSDWGDDVVATLSRRQLTHLLRDSLHFGGLVFTDALNMAAIANGRSPDEIATDAVYAGADVLLMSTDPEEARRGLIKAVMDGRISEERIDASVRRILEAKARLGLHRGVMAHLDSLVAMIHHPDHAAFALYAARKGVTLLNHADALPIRGDGRDIVLITIDHRSRLPGADSGLKLAAGMQERTPRRVGHIVVNPHDWRLGQPELVRIASASGTVVIADFTGRTPVSGWNRSAFYRGIRTAGRPGVIINMGSPYAAASLLPGPESVLMAYDESEATVHAVADALFGMIDIRGRLPVGISDDFPRGSGIDLDRILPLEGTPAEAGIDPVRLDRVDSVLTRAVADSAFPAAALAVGRFDTIVKEQTYGFHTYALDHPLGNKDLFDLASLTKVIATTTALMILYEEDRIDLDRPVAEYLPEFGQAGKDIVTIRDLLTHTGGLIPFRPFYAQGARGAADVRRRIMADSLVYPPGSESRYSDFGPIVLAWVIEKITGESFASFVGRRVFIPLGMYDTGFRRTRTGRYDRAVPTELDTYYRHRLMQGEVHDETAWLLGGTAGHAGLFSTMDDLARFASMLAGKGRVGSHRFLQASTIQKFTTRVDPDGASTRALGWDTRSLTGYSSAGSYFGPRSFGHTGFTGTSIWVDPDMGLFVILLTNRVYPSRDNRGHIAVRPAVADEVFQAVQSSNRDMVLEFAE